MIKYYSLTLFVTLWLKKECALHSLVICRSVQTSRHGTLSVNIALVFNHGKTYAVYFLYYSNILTLLLLAHISAAFRHDLIFLSCQ